MEPFVTETFVKELYRMISGQASAAYRQTALTDPSGFTAAAPEDLPHLMSHFFDQLMASAYLPPIEYAAMAHKRFLDIQPWPSHNEEMAFLITGCLLLQRGVRPLILPPERRADYEEALQILRTTYNMDPWIRLFTELCQAA